MARIKYTALIESIRGSIAGTTFQSNKYGFTVKKKPNMTLPRSRLQRIRQNDFSVSAREWRNTTQTERDRAISYASTFPQYARHNPDAQLDGYGIWMKITPLRLATGHGFMSGYPIVMPALVELTWVLTLSGGVLSIDMTASNQDELWIAIYYISRPLSPTINFVGSRTRLISSDPAATHSRVITDAYIDLFGGLPAVGDLVALDVVVIAFDEPFGLARTSTIYTIVS